MYQWCTLQELGSLSNIYGDENENGKKAIGSDSQNNNFARTSRFFMPLLHDYDVKLPKCHFYGGRR